MNSLTQKKLYKTGAIFQIVLAVFVVVFMFPSFLQFGFGADIINWREFTEKVFSSPASAYIQAILHGIVFLIFVFNLVALVFWKNITNFLFKLSIAFFMFPLAIYSLNVVLACFGIDAGMLYWFSDLILYILTGIGFALFVSAFVLFVLDTKNRNNQTTTYVVAKTFLWLVVALFNFVFTGISSGSGWFSLLFVYSGVKFPYFLMWMLSVLAIWQLVCGIKLNTNKKEKTAKAKALKDSQKRPVWRG